MGDLSASPSLDTPILNASISSESVRKAQSMHIRKAPLPQFSAGSDSSDSIDNKNLRHIRSKTLTEAVLSKGKGRFHRQKRHAIYADADMQLALSPPDAGDTFPVAVIISSEKDDTSDGIDTSDSFSSTKVCLSDSKASLHASYKQILRTTQPAIRMGSAKLPATSTRLLGVPTDWHSAPNFLVSPLTVIKNRNKVTRSHSSRDTACSTRLGDQKLSRYQHPIVVALLQDVDAAIKEWEIPGRF